MSKIEIIVYTYRNDTHCEYDPEDVSLILREEGASSLDDLCEDARGLTTLDFGMPDPEGYGLWAWVDEGTDPIGFDFKWLGHWRRLTVAEVISLAEGESESKSTVKLFIVPDSIEKSEKDEFT